MVTRDNHGSSDSSKSELHTNHDKPAPSNTAPTPAQTTRFAGLKRLSIVKQELVAFHTQRKIAEFVLWMINTCRVQGISMSAGCRLVLLWTVDLTISQFSHQGFPEPARSRNVWFRSGGTGTNIHPLENLHPHPQRGPPKPRIHMPSQAGDCLKRRWKREAGIRTPS